MLFFDLFFHIPLNILGFPILHVHNLFIIIDGMTNYHLQFIIQFLFVEKQTNYFLIEIIQYDLCH